MRMPAMPDGFDLDSYLTAIEGSSPVGRDLREDFTPQSYYYRLRDARAEARAAERSADSDGGEEASPPQWRTVRDLATKALLSETKDLEIAAWLTEALVRSDGLVGLAAGAALIDGLAKNFWDDGVFPLPDEDGISTRVAPITGLNGQGSDGTLVQPLRKVAICRRPTGDMLQFYQYEDAATVAAIADPVRKQSRLDAGSLAFNDVETWCRAAGQGHFGIQRTRVTEARDAWSAMAETLEAKAGDDSPATGRIRELLGDFLAIVGRYAAGEDAGGAAQAATADTGAAAPMAGAAYTPGVVGTGPARTVSREDMLREISRIAEWFRANEPTSPLSSTLDDAVRRARMSLPELLTELVEDSVARNAILSSLGIKPRVDE
jgi:type VI secretion system protein ImpA